MGNGSKRGQTGPRRHHFPPIPKLWPLREMIQKRTSRNLLLFLVRCSCCRTCLKGSLYTGTMVWLEIGGKCRRCSDAVSRSTAHSLPTSPYIYLSKSRYGCREHFCRRERALGMRSCGRQRREFHSRPLEMSSCLYTGFLVSISIWRRLWPDCRSSGYGWLP